MLAKYILERTGIQTRDTAMIRDGKKYSTSSSVIKLNPFPNETVGGKAEKLVRKQGRPVVSCR